MAESGTTILSAYMDTLNKLFSNVHPKRLGFLILLLIVLDKDIREEVMDSFSEYQL